MKGCRGSLELVLGGARSGKSDWAVRRARELGGTVLFIATAEPADDDMRARIEAHRAARPPEWRTLEESRHVTQSVRRQEESFDVIVLDCMTLLISNWMLEGSLDGAAGIGQGRAVVARIKDLCAALRSGGRHTIVVSNEVGSGVVPGNAIARRFRDELGAANRALADVAERVDLLIAGLPLTLKEGG